jgi:hypothetical protein
MTYYFWLMISNLTALRKTIAEKVREFFTPLLSIAG